MNEFKIKLELAGDTSMLALVRQLLPAVRKCGIPMSADAVRRCTLCLVEAFDNAVIHAHNGRRGLPVGIELAVSKRSITMKVRDKGAGFNIAMVPEPDIYQISGRGIFIIRNIASRVAYRDNTLIMEVRP